MVTDNPRIYRYTLTEIATLMGRSVHTVRDDKENGVFRPNDFKSTIRYMVEHGISIDSIKARRLND